MAEDARRNSSCEVLVDFLIGVIVRAAAAAAPAPLVHVSVTMYCVKPQWTDVVVLG